MDVLALWLVAGVPLTAMFWVSQPSQISDPQRTQVTLEWLSSLGMV